MEHSVVQPGEIHSPFQWVVTDAAARAAITPEGATDVHKVCLQLDTGAEWRLSGIGPNTWVEIVARAAPHEHDEAYAPLTHATNAANPHSVTKAQVGLGNADNTSDADKPVSTAQQIALDSKQSTLISGTSIMTLNGVSILNAGDLQVGGGIGAATTLFLNNSVAFADNFTLTPTPTGLPETNKSAVCNSGVAGGVGFIERYVSDPLGGLSIEGGIWRFNTYASATSNTGLNRVTTRVNKRSEVVGVTVTMTGAGLTRTLTATGGTPFIAGHATASVLTAALVELPTQTAWVSGYTSPTQVTITLTDSGFGNVTDVSLNAIYTLLFSVTTGDITGATAALYLVESTQPAFACVPSDRLVLAYFGVTDSGSNRSIGIYYDGQTHYSNTETPIAQRHNQLGGLNEGEYLHLSSADKTKLDGIATGAQVNVATNIAQGTRTTTTVPITSSTGTGATLGAATTSLAGVMSSADKTKLDGVATSANNYTHPANHAPSIITQDTNNRFVTDAEKATWNGKATPSDITTAINNLVDASPGTLDTLNELAAALGDDPNFATTMTNALAAKAPLASPTFTGTVGGITAAMVGLGNVDNTSDANKPVSTAQATANSAVQTAAATDASTKANAVLAELNSKLWIGI